MDPQRDRSAESERLVGQAWRLDSKDRAAFVARLRIDDPEIARIVEDALSPSESALDTPQQQSASDDRDIDVPPGYRIIDTLGQGGMGVTYLAEQVEPVRRRLALKVIRQDRLDESRESAEALRKRFRQERQALALMSHPHVAQVYEAGETSRGSLYFTMEYIAGTTIIDHCRREMVGIDGRLRLICQLCDALAHAHERGILHRDVTDRNVLVGESDDISQVKLIDFGLAKSLGPQLVEDACLTQIGALVGTPQYLAPEQWAVDPVDLDGRVDVYQVGVLLYRLLTGSFPYDAGALMQLSPDQLRLVLRNVDPSRRVST